MNTSKQIPQLVKSTCPYVVDYCTGTVLRPLPGSMFQRVCSIDKFEGWVEREGMISIAEAARRCGLKPKTIYCMIESGRLREEHGLRKIGMRYRILWSLLQHTIEKNALAGDGAPCT